MGWEAHPAAGTALSVGTVIGGIAQLALVMFATHRAGAKMSLRWPRLTPRVRRLITLGVPGVVAGGITQINIVIGTMIASLAPGAVSYLYYADRLYQLPLGIVGIAIGVVLLPDLARKLSQNNVAAAFASQNRSLEFALLLTLPAAVALMVAPYPLMQVLFQRGAFTETDTAQTSAALAAFAAGLPAFVLVKVFLPGFFAREDTRAPMRFTAISVAVNVLGSAALFPFFGHVGIAVATSLSGWTNAALLFATLVRRGHFQADATLRRRAPRILASSVAMGAVLWGAAFALAPYFSPENGLAKQTAALALLIGAGLFTYAMSAQITGAMTLSALRRAFSRE
jgi:putative peptidoglycan lipid II flippase